jgi:hypothetical protein
MMKLLVPLLIAIVCGFAAPARAEQPQPRMEDAMTELQQARDSKEPLPLLEKALGKLQHAKHNKGGRRPDAIEAVKDAIELAKKGENSSEKITHAIAMIHAGMDHGR